MKKGVRNLRFLTTLVLRRYMTATCLIVTAICLTLRQLTLYNCYLPLFSTSIVLYLILKPQEYLQQKNLKFLTPFFIFLTIIINIILSTNHSYVISPYNTNTDQQLTLLLYYRVAKYSQKEISYCTNAIYIKRSCLPTPEFKC